jgi:hypothetical protein
MACNDINTQEVIHGVLEREKHGGVNVGDGERQPRVHVVAGPDQAPVYLLASDVKRCPAYSRH